MRSPARITPPLGFLLAFLIVSSPVFAGLNRWTPFGPPEGSLFTVALDGSGGLYAAADAGSVYKSSDSGDTWSWSGVGMGSDRVRALVYDPDDGDLYAAGETRIYRSTDEGRSWQTVARDPELAPVALESDVLALSPGEPDVLFLGRENRLFRGGGAGGVGVWERVLDAEARIATVLVDPNAPQSVFVGLESFAPISHGLLHSTDGGETWAPVTDFETESPFQYGVKELDVVATSPTTMFAVTAGALLRSVDAGASWRIVRTLPHPGVGSAESLIVVPGPEPVVYAIQGIPDLFPQEPPNLFFGLFASRDLGQTWSRVDEGGLPVQRSFNLPPTLLAEPGTGDLWAFALDRVLEGVDGGRHWVKHLLGTQLCGYGAAGERRPKLRFRPGNPSRMYAVVGSRLWTSGDAGKSWRILAEDVVEGCVKLSDVVVDPGRRDTLYAASGEGVFRSTDGGETWTHVLRGRDPLGHNPRPPMHFLNLASPRSGEVVAAGWGIWQSGDFGGRWQPRLSRVALYPQFDEPEFARDVVQLVIDPSRPQILYAGAVESGERHPPRTYSYIYRSTDGGRTWRKLLENAHVIAIDPSDSRTLYALGLAGLRRSRDDGRTWQRISSFGSEPAQADLEVDPFDPRTLWAARRDGVWRSTDGGVTWERQNQGLHRNTAFASDLFFHPRRPGLLYVASNGLFEGYFP
ncbi:MAG TPA: hypothetical protein VF756_31860 [Thermoanaerobaculia bacterium]